MSISELYRNLNPVSPVSTPKENIGVKQPKENKGPSDFQKILNDETKLFNLSQHAETRIKSRDLPWDSHMEKRIASGIDQAESKGSRETLILADNLAVIANVKSRTVVTAMDRDQMKERVFTNIDSAVLV